MKDDQLILQSIPQIPATDISHTETPQNLIT